MKEIILCKYGEIVLKGANKSKFEDSLCREMKKRAAAYGDFDVYKAQSTLYIDPKNSDADMDGMTCAACRVFGITTVSRAAVCGKTTEDICETAKKYIPPFLKGYGTFKVDTKSAKFGDCRQGYNSHSHYFDAILHFFGRKIWPIRKIVLHLQPQDR